ncbi:MAG: flippase [Thermodesulfobacteriota bacterium]|nr:flippase [Thermodesulfobacteriota bacterium]
MNVVKRIAKNSSVTMGTGIVNMVGALLTLAVVARYLDAERFGEYIFVMAFIAVFEVLTDMGYNAILVREIARAKDQLTKVVGTAVIVKFFVALLSFGLILISATVFELAVELSPEVKNAICVMALVVTLDFFVDICISTIRAHEKMEYEAIIVVFNRVTTVLFIGLVAMFNLGFLSLFLARLYSNILTSGLAIFVYVRRFGKLQLDYDISTSRHLTKEALPLGVGQLVDRLYITTNFFLIRIIQSAAEVGFYGGAYRIIQKCGIVAVSIVAAVFPVFSKLSQSSVSSLALAHEKTLKFLVAISLPVVVIVICMSKKITTILFGTNVLEIAQSLKILAFCLVLNFSNLLFKFTLNAMNKQLLYRRNILVAFVTNLVLALLLIPVYGHIGACVAFLASSGLLFVLGHWSISKYMAGVSLKAALVRPFASALVMAVFLVLGRDINFYLVVPGSILAYVVSSAVLGTFTIDEIRMLQSARTGPRDHNEEDVRYAPCSLS